MVTPSHHSKHPPQVPLSQISMGEKRSSHYNLMGNSLSQKRKDKGKERMVRKKNLPFVKDKK